MVIFRLEWNKHCMLDNVLHMNTRYIPGAFNNWTESNHIPNTYRGLQQLDRKQPHARYIVHTWGLQQLDRKQPRTGLPEYPLETLESR